MMEFSRNSPELLLVQLSTTEAQGEDISHRNEGKKPRMRWEGRNQQILEDLSTQMGITRTWTHNRSRQKVLPTGPEEKN
jgi:hypothetical protein